MEIWGDLDSGEHHDPIIEESKIRESSDFLPLKYELVGTSAGTIKICRDHLVFAGTVKNLTLHLVFAGTVKNLTYSTGICRYRQESNISSGICRYRQSIIQPVRIHAFL